jgi:hypothetical protein
VEVYNLLHGQLQQAETQFNDFYAKDVPAFIDAMAKHGVEKLMTVAVK